MAATKKIPDIHAVLGSDEARVKQTAAERAVRMTPPDAGDFGVETFDGTVDNSEQAVTRIHEVMNALQTLPFLGGGKLVWFKNPNFFADGVVAKSTSVEEASLELIEALKEGLPDGVRFLISIPGINKSRAFYKRLSKLCKPEIFDKIDTGKEGWEADAGDLARRMGREHGLDFEPEALELLALLVGAEAGRIGSEVEKLHLYLGTERRQVELADVHAIVAQTRAGGIFELGNAVLRRDLPLALDRLDQLLHQGEYGVGILLVAIAPQVRNLLLAKDLMRRHNLRRPAVAFHFMGALKRLPEDAVRHLPRKKDGGLNSYPVSLAAVEAHRFQAVELVRGLEACLKANLDLVSTGGSDRITLSQLLIRLLG